MAANTLDGFIAAHSRNMEFEVAGLERLIDGQPIADLIIEFADGFDSGTFNFTEGQPIPIILSARFMEERGLMLGDRTYISHRFPAPRGQSNPNEEVMAQVWIVGQHNRHILSGDAFRDAIIMPLEALQELKGSNLGYTALQFTIDPQFNRDIHRAQQAIRNIFGSGYGVVLVTYFDDAELRNVVGPMEDNLSLLQILYPVAIGVALTIGAGLSLLMTLQNTKNAAILRVLGSTRNRTGVMLWLEIFIVCLTGLFFGLITTAIMWNVLPIPTAGLYLLGAVTGTIIGIFLVINRAPLELLQVKE
jgi:hypothetical protein